MTEKQKSRMKKLRHQVIVGLEKKNRQKVGKIKEKAYCHKAHTWEIRY